MCLDVSHIDGDEAAGVSVLRVYRSEEAARAEVYRHRADDANEDHHYFYEATEVERAS
jgi:hypothetical protein